MSEWQTIETAPKNGIAIFVFSWADGITRAAHYGHGWYVDGTDRDNARNSRGQFIKLYPTHWMPLPKPPVTP